MSHNPNESTPAMAPTEAASFTALPLRSELQQALAQADYHTMTPIQAASLPALLAGRDVIAQAKTGSGKTAAFALTLLQNVQSEQTRLQSLVLCPTRELADQISRELRLLAKKIANVKVLTLCGGVPLRPHLASLTHTPHIAVGTPGRILELLELDALPMDALQQVVLDEADRMLDMGFVDAIRAILQRTPSERQTLLFSATYPDEIRALSQSFQRDPLSVTVQSTLSAEECVQELYQVANNAKHHALTRLLSAMQPRSALVFCNTRHAVQELQDELQRRGYSTCALHGDLEQRERDEMLVCFANQSARVMLATDVAARGLDIQELPLVVNFDVANDFDAHTHRIGRTARAGAKGVAVTLVSNAERRRIDAFAATMAARSERALEWHALPNAPELPLTASYQTLAIDAGRQDKLRPGDVLGALTAGAGLAADDIGKIDVFPTRSYVAVKLQRFKAAYEQLSRGKIKGRSFRVRKIR
jgi:ATP-dependent RNA helicase DbpA